MKLDRFINRPVLSTVISIVIVILGIIGMISLPITQYPDIAPPTITVRATYTGANAETVLKSVIAPLEDQLNGVENMMYMSSTASNNGSAMITLFFKQGSNPDMDAVNVQNRVSMAQGLLPAEVTQVGVITMKRQTSFLVMFSIYDKSGHYDTKFLENYAKINLIPEIQRIPGVGETQVMGGDYSMRIWLKPDVMAEYHLVPKDVTQALAEQNVEAAPGAFGEQGNQAFEYTIRYKGRLQKPSEFDNIVIKAKSDGQVLHLKDIATIELGRISYGFVNNVDGHKAVMCVVNQMPGTNATAMIQEIQKSLNKSEKIMPPGMGINISMNANDFLYASIHEVIKTLLEAFILVFLVVYVFLQDLRSTLIPAIAIPVALIGTFGVLSVIGFSINILTLCALVLAIAIVVDDAIVVVEGVHAKLDQGYKSAKVAAIDAMNELGGAIVSITLVMMAVFIPVSFLGGTAGVFYRQFGLTMAIAIGISALNALTLSPALCAIFLKPHDENGKTKKSKLMNRFHTSFNTAYESMLGKYKKNVQFFIQHKKITFGIVGAAIVALFVLMKVTPTEMVPTEDQGVVMGTLTMPPGTSQEHTLEVMTKVDSLISSDPAIQTHTAIQGFSFLGGQGSCYGSFVLKLKDWKDRSMMQNVDIVSATLLLRAQKIVKDGQVLFFAPPSIPGYSASNDIQLNMQDKTGGSINKFYEVVKAYQEALLKRPEIKSAQSSFNPNFPQYMIDIDAAACKKAGISPSDILTTMQGYYGGLYASNFNRFGKMYRVMVQADPAYRTNLESLKNIKVRNGDEMAPISQFMSIKKVYGPDVISRFNMYTAITVMVAPASGFTNGQAMKAIQEVANNTLPAGFSYELGGMAREEASSSSNMTTMIFLLCFVFIYLLLSAQYESYILPLAVLLSVPFGLLGSFLFVNGIGALGNIQVVKMIVGTMSNNIYMQIALIMLIGLLAKNAILIVEFSLDRRKMGMALTWSAILGAAARLRPILMTSFAMIIGLLPMMFSFGAGGHGYRTLGTAAIGGMLIGMLLQIFIVPTLFVVFQYLQEKIKPIVWENMDNSDLNSEIEQYTKIDKQ